MTPDQRASKVVWNTAHEGPIGSSKWFGNLWEATTAAIKEAEREAERLAYERAVKVAHDKAEELRALADKRRATGNRTTATIDARATELYSLAAAIRALSQPETPAEKTEGT